MPRGTQHELVGVLLAGDVYPILRVDDGGEWRLDVGRRYRHLLGSRVRVRGTRAEFDMLDVEQIGPA
ncbi:MAG: hypothetical protein COC10_05110 [Sphingobium sp.]|nr:MAG: hypothetical protein COC10_05110 [Sphingobium sp.]